MRIYIRNNRRQSNYQSKRGEAGVTLIEMMIAILLMSVGMLAAASVVTYGLQTNTFSRNTTESKVLASAMVEQIETLRNTGQLTFRQICNEGDPENTSTFPGFRSDFVGITRNPGIDGVFGTVDDDMNTIDAGARQFTRRVRVTKIPFSTIKKIEVTIRYPGFTGGAYKDLTVTSYLNDNERTNQSN